MAKTPLMGQENKDLSASSHKIRKRDVAGYLLLPRLLPRISELFFSGFTLFAFFMAQVYRGVRLLPEAHPYLNAANIGNFGVRDVIGAAASHLVFRRENIDQIIIFFAILLGLILIVIQAAIFVIALATPQATAQGLGIANMFGTPQYTASVGGAPLGTSQDLAFIMMDRVFGVQGIFNSCISTNTPCYGVHPTNLTFDKANEVYKPATFPWPYHLGLHSMFAFYSTALLLVGMLIIIYYAVVVVVETAQTGTPFGKRFNTVWAPIRLVIAIGLLIPIGTGLNSAQYITLYVAKYGSNFATNGWLEFNKAIRGQAQAMANGQGLVVEPQAQDIGNLLKFMIVAHGCKAIEEILPTEEYTAPNNQALTTAETELNAMPRGTAAEQTAYNERSNSVQRMRENAQRGCTSSNANLSYENMNRYRHIDAYVVSNGNNLQASYAPLMGLTHEQAKGLSQNGDIVVRFGDQSCKNTMYSGMIAPLCGEVVLPTSSLSEPGALKVQEGYFNLLKYLWGGYGARGTGSERNPENTLPLTFTNTGDPSKGRDNRFANICNAQKVTDMINAGGSANDKFLRARGFLIAYEAIKNSCVDTAGTTAQQRQEAFDAIKAAYPDSKFSVVGKAYQSGAGDPANSSITNNNGVFSTTLVPVLPEYQQFLPSGKENIIITNIIRIGADELRGSISAGNQYNISAEALARGWAAAGIWYNKIAQMNGALTGAAWSLPAPSQMPRIVQQGMAQQSLNDNATSNMVSRMGGSQPMQMTFAEDRLYYNSIMQTIGQFTNAQAVTNPSSGNIFGDIINNLFGLQGLFNMRNPVNAGAHPLAQLVGVGKSLIEASIRNLGAGLGIGGLGILGQFLSSAATGGALDGIVGIANSISGLMFSIATITLTAGFILYYVVPFLPFLYFFFAVGNWLKGVFEAMVGVPLWALAHLRIDGNGLPGEAAINGYFMLFEIFLRPILIVFGLLASVTIFAAMGAVLNDVYDTVIGNLTGANPGGGARMASVDRLFYTIMYAVIMYMMALSSFKLIDLIPNQIMRWMGTSVSTFSDMSGDPAQTLTQYTAIAGSQIVGQVTSGTQQFMQGLQGAARSGGSAMRQMGTPPQGGGS